jgi:hypothetical protein
MREVTDKAKPSGSLSVKEQQMNTKRIASEILILVAATFIAGSGAHAQSSNEQRVTVTISPAQTPEERVANEFKEKELRRVAEEKLAAEQSARIAEKSPKTLLGRARTVYISSSTSFFEPVQLQHALAERTEFESWEMTIVDGWEKRSIADIIVAVDRPLFTYTFTYQITDRSTGIIVATGKVTAFDGNAAAPQLASKIVEDIKKARGESKVKK